MPAISAGAVAWIEKMRSWHFEPPLVALTAVIHRGLVNVMATVAAQLALVRVMRVGRDFDRFLGQRSIADVTAEAGGSADRCGRRIFLVARGTIQSCFDMKLIQRAVLRRCGRGR